MATLRRVREPERPPPPLFPTEAPSKFAFSDPWTSSLSSLLGPLEEIRSDSGSAIPDSDERKSKWAFLEGLFSAMAGMPEKQPIKQPTEMPTSTMALMGRFPLVNGPFSDLNGAFP